MTNGSISVLMFEIQLVKWKFNFFYALSLAGKKMVKMR